MNEDPRINTSQDFLEKIKDMTSIGMFEGWFKSYICNNGIDLSVHVKMASTTLKLNQNHRFEYELIIIISS